MEGKAGGFLMYEENGWDGGELIILISLIFRAHGCYGCRVSGARLFFEGYKGVSMATFHWFQRVIGIDRPL